MGAPSAGAASTPSRRPLTDREAATAPVAVEDRAHHRGDAGGDGVVADDEVRRCGCPRVRRRAPNGRCHGRGLSVSAAMAAYSSHPSRSSKANSARGAAPTCRGSDRPSLSTRLLTRTPSMRSMHTARVPWRTHRKVVSPVASWMRLSTGSDCAANVEAAGEVVCQREHLAANAVGAARVRFVPPSQCRPAWQACDRPN